MGKTSPANLLIIADSEHNADLLHAVGMFVPDPFIFLRLGGRDHVVMNDLEIDRARRQAPQCRVISLSECQAQLRRAGVERPGLPEVAALLLRRRRLRKIAVPEHFPLGLAVRLSALKIRTVAVNGPVFPQREFKTAAEVRKIAAALRMAEAGMAAGRAVLRAAKISRNRRLSYRGAPLTSERLRAVIDTAVLQAGGLPAHTIVAGGRQACDPHERGHGPLRAREAIIVDIFPRSQTTGYFGDITRTFVKGRAGEAVRRLHATVARGQDLAFRQMRAGQATREIHRSVQEYFDRQGYRTGKRQGRWEGFFHGTGHGLGLEIHEPPRVGATSSGVLRAGQVVTVEPGLYYPEIGAVRLENVAVITEGNPRNLTRFERVLEI